MNNDNDVIEILDDITEDTDNMVNTNNSMNMGTTVSNPVNSAPIIDNTFEQSKVEDNNSKEITIESESEKDNAKSGLPFVIVLFILLIAFIIGLPYISKLIP